MTEASATETQRLEAWIKGVVQGVGFRYWVVKRAAALGLTGWVANELDGSVHCIAEGPPEALDQLEALLRAGPIGSVVRDVSAVRMPATNTFSGFGVRSAGHRGD